MTKLIAMILLAIGLAAGALAASTAYLVKLSLPTETLTMLTLGADAGLVDEPGRPSGPVVQAKTDGEPTKLTPEHVAALRDAGVTYVRVREFDLRRWPYLWLFALSVLPLLGGAFMLRAAAKPRTLEPGEVSDTPDARAALAALHADIAPLRGTSDTNAVIEKLGDALDQHAAAFVEARPALIAEHGLGDFARVMDAFAGAERTLHRAWSAAADNVPEEMTDALDRGITMIEHVQKVLDDLG